MKIPKFCYEKAFWIVIPILITFFGSLLTGINAEIDKVGDLATENSNILAERTVPVDAIEKLTDKIDIVIGNQRVLCHQAGVQCK